MVSTRTLQLTISLMEVLGKIGKVYLHLLESMDFCLSHPLDLVIWIRVFVRGMEKQLGNARTGSTTR